MKIVLSIGQYVI